MARPLRFEYAGAVYHVMARGDGGKAIFIAKDDHLLFLHRLGEVCRSRGWRVQHATWSRPQRSQEISAEYRPDVTMRAATAGWADRVGE